MKTNERYFKAVAADMRATEERGQTNYQAYATMWELAYHKVLAISKGYGEILKNRFGKYRCKSFAQRTEEYKYFGIQRYNEAVNNFFL